jgi:hypothetical protein
VTGLEFLGEVGGHEGSACLRVGCEVSLARLASRRGDCGGVLHFIGCGLWTAVDCCVCVGVCRFDRGNREESG